MLEERLTSVVTVEVDPKAAKASPFFGFTSGQTSDAPTPRPKPYENSFFLTRTGASGSGFVVRNGNLDYVVTNSHVVRDMNPDKISVISLSGKRYAMILVGVDSIRDIAVLRFAQRPGPEISPATFRPAPVRIGERVYALGTPLGRYPSSVSDGIVSGVNRQSAGNSAGYVQSTASLSGGNSGGPLVDSSGRVVGVNTWSAVDVRKKQVQMHLNFSLDAKVSADTVDQIIQKNRVKRGSLGVLIAGTSSDEIEFAIVFAHPDVPEAIRNKVVGRRLVSINGVEIQNAIQLFGLLDSIPPKQAVKIGLGASQAAPAELVIITSGELTDERLEFLADAYLSGVLGVKATQDDKHLRIELATTKFCNPIQFVLKELLDEFIPERSEDVTKTFVSDIAGALGMSKDGPVLNNDDLYAIRTRRELNVLVRATSAQGIFTFLFGKESKSYAITLAPMIDGERVQFLLH